MTQRQQLSMDLGIEATPGPEQRPGAAGNPRDEEAELRDAHALVPQALRKQLRRNGRKSAANAPPVLKIFSPVGAATWLIHSQEPVEDPDILFGLCDLGMGFPELGSVSLQELQELEVPARLVINGREEVTFRMKLERDLHFRPQHSLEVYAEAALEAGQITENPQALEEAARRAGHQGAGRKGRRTGR